MSIMHTTTCQVLPEVETLLPINFMPTINHVIIGRGKKTYNHPGNVLFCSVIQSRIEEYSQTKNKKAKSRILVDIIRQVHSSGGFVKEDPATGRWMTSGTFLAREKVSQTFRDTLSDGYKSSKTSKRKRRQERLASSEEECAQSEKRRRRECNDEAACFPNKVVFPTTLPHTSSNLSDKELLARLCNVISPNLDDTSSCSLEPTPVWEDNYDIDEVFDVIPSNDTSSCCLEPTPVWEDDYVIDKLFESSSETAPSYEDDELDTIFDDESSVMPKLDEELSSSSELFFETADFFMVESRSAKSKHVGAADCNHESSADVPEFQPLRNIASARTA